MTAVPERFLLAKERISPEKSDYILEIGCGTGILIQELSSELDSGAVVGIDKSKPAIEKALKKNQKAIREKKVTLINEELKKAKFPKGGFNKIVSFNVNLFLKGSEEEFNVIRKILAPGGKIFVFYQFPYEIDVTAGNPIADNLERNGFFVTDKELISTNSTSIVFIKAMRSS